MGLQACGQGQGGDTPTMAGVGGISVARLGKMHPLIPHRWT